MNACQSKKKSDSPYTEHPQSPKDYHPANAQQLTFVGENSDGQFNLTGKKIIFISKKRPQHNHSQVYLLDLTSKKERRVTFQDGENASPIFLYDEEKIVYASTTDEAKESDPRRLEEAKKINFDLNPYELYSSDLAGGHITRLTQHPLYDGRVNFNFKTQSLLYSTMNNGQLDLATIKKNNLHGQIISETKDKNEAFAQASPKGDQLAYAEYDESFLFSKLILSNVSMKEKTTLSQEGVFYVESPSWDASGNFLIYTSNQSKYENFEIYVYDFANKCHKRLTYLASQEHFPSFSPDGKSILFTSDLSGVPQLYSMPFIPPTSCLN